MIDFVIVGESERLLNIDGIETKKPIHGRRLPVSNRS